MIEISRDKNHVKVGLSAFVPYWQNRVFLFYWDAGNEWAAGLLADLLQKTFFNKIKDIREKAYDQGWKDAKSNRAKETYFSGYLG